MRAWKRGELLTFRPLEAFDLSGAPPAEIRAHHLVADLLAADDAAAEWRQIGRRRETGRFNFDRTLC